MVWKDDLRAPTKTKKIKKSSKAQISKIIQTPRITKAKNKKQNKNKRSNKKSNKKYHQQKVK